MGDEIGVEIFEKLIKSYNDMRDEDYLFIYLNSEGGEVAYAESIIHLINENCDRTVLIAHGDICSAAFEIFFRTLCERKILPGTSGMAHSALVPLWVKTNAALDEAGKNNIEWSKKDFKRKLDFYSSIGFTNKEIKCLKAGKDVWMDDDRLHELLSNHIKLINAGYH